MKLAKNIILSQSFQDSARTDQVTQTRTERCRQNSHSYKRWPDIDWHHVNKIVL